MGLTQRFAVLATDLIARLGYGGLAVGLIVDSAGVPIPSEVLLPLAGALVRQGRMDFWLIIIVSTVAQTIGATLAYWIGASGGLVLVERYGKYVLFKRHELELTQRWFARYGAWLALVGRCLPVIRTYIGYPAGLARMPLGRFIAASAVGSFAWSVILVTAGYQLFDRLDVIDNFLRRFSLVVVALLGVALIWYLIRKGIGNRA